MLKREAHYQTSAHHTWFRRERDRETEGEVLRRKEVPTWDGEVARRTMQTEEAVCAFLFLSVPFF